VKNNDQQNKQNMTTVHYSHFLVINNCTTMENGTTSSKIIEEAYSQSTPSVAGSFDINKLIQLDNPVFSGGFGLAMLAAGAQLLRFGSSAAMNIARKNLFVTLEVTSKDRSYPWVLHWLTARGSRTQHLSVETTLKSTLSGGTNTRFGFVPGPGFHLIWYKNHFLGVQRLREQQMVDLNTGKPWEKVQFMGIGRNTEIFESILQEAYDMATRQEEGKTIIFTNWGTEWRPFGQPRARRSLESVILDEGVGEKIFADVCEWRASSDWYMDRGIPYRRGYLLYGPPGSGKTSFIMALAGKMGYNICVLNLAERGLTDDRLAVALSSVPPQVNTTHSDLLFKHWL
jgi:mitochondrial chaperone BCS1